MKSLLFFALCIFTSASCWGALTVDDCTAKPEPSAQGRLLPNLKALPKMLFLARKVDFYVESKNDPFKMWSEQSFIKGKSKVLCATLGKEKAYSFSIYGPTLIDLTEEKGEVDSYWQFHMTANAKQFGIWNKKTRLFPKTKDLESATQKLGAQAQVVQISQHEYELSLVRDNEQTLEILIIRFDAVPNLK